MRLSLLTITTLFLFGWQCAAADIRNIEIYKHATLIDTLRPYSTIIFEKKQILNSAPGTKSVLFNSSGSRLYAMNLEGMSVYEFDRAARKVVRVFKFRAT